MQIIKKENDFKKGKDYEGLLVGLTQASTFHNAFTASHDPCSTSCST